MCRGGCGLVHCTQWISVLTVKWSWWQSTAADGIAHAFSRKWRMREIVDRQDGTYTTYYSIKLTFVFLLTKGDLCSTMRWGRTPFYKWYWLDEPFKPSNNSYNNHCLSWWPWEREREREREREPERVREEVVKTWEDEGILAYMSQVLELWIRVV